MPVASEDALLGLGFPAQLANLLGGNPSQLTCIGTAQTGAAIIKSKNTELVTAGGATACILPPDAQIMVPYVVVNPTATTGLVFVPSGHTLIQTSGSSLNGSLSLAQFKSVILWQYKSKFWASVLTA